MAGDNVTLKQANAALRALPDDLKIELQAVFDGIAFQVARKADDLAPVLKHPATYRLPMQLKSAISWQSRPGSLSAVVVVNRALAFYWKFVEFGTIKMAAIPFLRPAADAFRVEHNRRVQQVLEKAANRMAAGASATSSGPTNTGTL